MKKAEFTIVNEHLLIKNNEIFVLLIQRRLVLRFLYRVLLRYPKQNTIHPHVFNLKRNGLQTSGICRSPE